MPTSMPSVDLRAQRRLLDDGEDQDGLRKTSSSLARKPSLETGGNGLRKEVLMRYKRGMV